MRWKRFFVCLSAIVTLVACRVGSRSAVPALLATFIVPGATDITVATLRWNRWQLHYHAPGDQKPWSTTVERRLTAQGWHSPAQTGYGALSRTYSRAISFKYYEVWEWAYLNVDPLHPDQAQILVRWDIVVPAWQQLYDFPDT